MKFTRTTGFFILLTAILPAVNGNAQTEPRSQPSSQPACLAVKPSERSTITSEQSTTQRSEQVQQRSACALNTQPQPVQAEPKLSERDRLIKERSEQRIIPPQDSSGDDQ